MPLPCSCPCLCHAYILWDRRVPCLWPCLLCSCFRLLLLVVAIRPLSSSMQWVRRLVRCPWLSPSSAAPAPRRKKPAAMGRSVSQRRSVLRRPAGVIENASKVDWAWVDAQQEALRECVPGRRRGLVVTTHYSGNAVAEMTVQRVTPGHVRFHGACDPICTEVLLNHQPECAAEHVMLAATCGQSCSSVAGNSTLVLRRRAMPSLLRPAMAAQLEPQPSLARLLVVRAATVQDIGLEWVEVAMKSWSRGHLNARTPSIALAMSETALSPQSAIPRRPPPTCSDAVGGSAAVWSPHWCSRLHAGGLGENLGGL